MAKRPTKATVIEIFTRLRASNPDPKSDLEWTNTYTLLVAVVLSAQATDKGVNKATHKLFKMVDTPEKMVALGIEGLKSHIKTIGLYNAKAANVMALSHQLIANHGGAVPDTMDELVKLPGVGRKTANVVLNIAFEQNTLAVDTHVFRVAHRLGFSDGSTPDAVERDLLKLMPLEFARHAHHWLILHGRYICVARKPKCEICPLTDLCPYYKNLTKRGIGRLPS